MNVENSPPLKTTNERCCVVLPPQGWRQKKKIRKSSREKQERGQGGGAAIQFVGRGTGGTRQGGPEVVVKSCQGKRHKKERERKKTPKQSRRTVHSRGGRWTCSIRLLSLRPSALPSLSVVERTTFVCYRPSGSSRVRRSNFPVTQSTSWQQLFS